MNLSADTPPPPTTPESPGRGRNWLGFAGAPSLAAAVTGGLLILSDWPREAAFMSGIFVLAGVLWVTEALPLFATALLVIGLQIVLLTNPGAWPGLGFAAGPSPSYRDLLAQAADPVLVLFFGGFVLAQAAVKEGVDRAMSSLLLGPFGSEPRRVLLGVMLVTVLFSMWMSNTATTAMMLALVMPMLARMPPGEPFRKALVLAVPFAANLGGMGTPIASPPNAVAMGFLQRAGYQVDFLGWMLVALPLVLVLTLFTWWLLGKNFAPATPELRLVHASARLTPRGWLVVAVFTTTVVLWMTDQWHGLPAAVVALLPAVILTATRIFTRDDLGKLEWSILILIAGGISLGGGLQSSGLDRIVAESLPAAGAGAIALLAGLVLATMVIGTFMSNTATANLILPVGISAAVATGPAGGLSPVQAAVSIALAAALGMSLPVSTPPNAMAYARGEFTTRDMARVAVPVGLVAAFLLIGGGGVVMRFWGLLD